MAEIRSDQYQNRDKQKDVEIKRDVKLYITKSYMTVVFLCISMFNTLTTANEQRTLKPMPNFNYFVTHWHYST